MPAFVAFDENECVEFKSISYAYSPPLLKENRSEPEKKFEAFLGTNADKLTFWYKNGDSGKSNFGIRYTEGERVGTFYPDFIVGFADGRIGIFDTKSGFTETSSDTAAKAEALQVYIVAENEKGKNLFGGIIAESKQKELKINRAKNYGSQIEAAADWVYLVDVFKF